MNDTDRWVNLEGPEPERIRRLLDADRLTRRTPEEAARMKRSIRRAVAAQRGRERNYRWVWATAGAAFALALVLAVTAALAPVARSAGSPLQGIRSALERANPPGK